MVAQLDDASMQIVVQGEDNRSRGIVSCCMFQAGSYDHKRHHATGKHAGNRAAGKYAGNRAARKSAIEGQQPMALWDFKLIRDDGSSILLHPQWSKTKFTYKTHCPPFDGEYPRSGLGGTGRREPG